jgi:hypothetical protein
VRIKQQQFTGAAHRVQYNHQPFDHRPAQSNQDPAGAIGSVLLSKVVSSGERKTYLNGVLFTFCAQLNFVNVSEMITNVIFPAVTGLQLAVSLDIFLEDTADSEPDLWRVPLGAAWVFSRHLIFKRNLS